MEEEEEGTDCLWKRLSTRVLHADCHCCRSNDGSAPCRSYYAVGGIEATEGIEGIEAAGKKYPDRLDQRDQRGSRAFHVKLARQISI